MFNIAVLRDTVRILPEDFRRDAYQTIADALNRKYANKVPGRPHLEQVSFRLFMPYIYI